MPAARRDPEVILDVVFDRGLLFLSWSLRNAWPVKLDAGPLGAQANEVAIETLELAHEGFELE